MYSRNPSSVCPDVCLLGDSRSTLTIAASEWLSVVFQVLSSSHNFFLAPCHPLVRLPAQFIYEQWWTPKPPSTNLYAVCIFIPSAPTTQKERREGSYSLCRGNGHRAIIKGCHCLQQCKIKSQARILNTLGRTALPFSPGVFGLSLSV